MVVSKIVNLEKHNCYMKRIVFFSFLILAGLAQAQVKKSKSKKPEKEWVNPVKLTKEERNRPYMTEVLKTRDPLTLEEAERRRKNIEAGNPFKKYGYYPKVATLSKGKYLEFHDKDSIVVIGSVKFNTKTQKVIDILEIDLSDPDAQPIGDTHGKWISPDPLSEEFSSWSPYNYVFNNPISNIDPDGMAPLTDYKLLKNGEVQRVNPLDGTEKDKSDTLFATDSRGNVDKSKSVTVAKDKPSDGSVISGLSEGGELTPKILGQSTAPYFSEGFTQNLNDAFNVYNFLDNNTNSGVEFSLANYNVNGQDNFQIATMHDIDGSQIKSNRYSNDNLIWSAHNHDGPRGLDYKNVGNQWGQDKITMNGIFRNNASKGLGFPRFFTVNDNNRMIEITRTGQNTSNTQPFNVQFLKSLKRVYGSK